MKPPFYKFKYEIGLSNLENNSLKTVYSLLPAVTNLPEKFLSHVSFFKINSCWVITISLGALQPEKFIYNVYPIITE